MPRFFERGDPSEREQRDLEAKLKGAVDRRVDNAVRLQTAETKLTEACTLVEKLALGADDAKLDAALQARRGAEDKLSALRGAATRIGEEVSELESQIDRIVDQRCRGETAAAITSMIERFEKTGAVFDAACLDFIAAAKELGLIVGEALGIAEFLERDRVQLPPENAMVIGRASGHRAGVLAGGKPPSLPRPAAPAPVLTVVPQEPHVNVFVTRNIRYVASGGDVVCCGQNRRHDLPERIAELAIAARAAVLLTDRARIAAFEGTSGMYVPTPQACEWIGPKGKEPAPLQMRPGPAPVHHSLTAFTPMDRGPPIVGSMPALPLAVGARKLDAEE